MTNSYKIKINRVIDGDSFDVDISLGFGIVLTDRRVRLKGVDTPELRTSDNEEKKYGLMAKEFVIRWCERDCSLVMEDCDDEQDKFGRILGDFRDNEGNSLVNDIIANYHGVAYHGQTKDNIRQEHLANRKKLTA